MSCSRSTTPRRNIGVRSGIRTRSTAGEEAIPSTLESLFGNLQRSISTQFQEQQRLFDSRWEEERERAEERQAAEEAATSAKEAAVEGRLRAMENQYQVLSANFKNFIDKFSATVIRSGDRESTSVNNSVLVNNPVSTGLAMPPLSQLAPSQEANGVLRSVPDLGYVMRPPVFDGKACWEEYKMQFEAIARANRWDEPRKALALVASLEGPARRILTSLADEQRNDFGALVSALEFRFGTKNFSNLNYVKFQNYKQRNGESISELASEIEMLAQAAFCDCPMEIRDKLAASQFVSSLANKEMKRMMRLGGFSSLRTAVIRALEIEAVESVAAGPC